jgi:tetratricopeptide (TPR) repeat protein
MLFNLRITFFALLALLRTNLHAQTSDSLERVLKTTRSDTVKLNILFALHASTADRPLREKYTKQAAALAKKLEKSSVPEIEYAGRSGVAMCILMEGQALLDIGESKRSLEYFSRAYKLQKAIGDKKHMASTHNSQGIAYFNLGETDKALYHYNKALKIQEQTGDKAGLG